MSTAARMVGVAGVERPADDPDLGAVAADPTCAAGAHEIANSPRGLARAPNSAIAPSCDRPTEPSPGVRMPRPGGQGSDHRTARIIGEEVRFPPPRASDSS